jgi:hypothetical protein
MPDQGILVECDAVADPLGDPFAVLPAQALHGYRGIALTPTDSSFETTILGFARDEAIYLEGGMLAHCPRPRALFGDEAPAPLYEVVDRDAARRMVAEASEGRDGLGLACDPEEIARIDACQRTRPARPVNT